MSRNDKNRDIFEKILDKYQLTDPADADEKKELLSRQGRIFKKVLKSTRDYSIVYGFFMSFYFFLKRYGIVISVKSSIITAVAIATIASGVYIAKLYYPLIFDEPETKNTTVDIIKDIKPPEKENAAEEMEKPKDVKVVPEVKYTIGIKPFESRSLDRKTLNTINNIILQELGNQNRENYVIRIGKSKKNVRYMFFGSIEKFDNEIIIMVKIIDSEISSIEYMKESTVSSIKDLEKETAVIARELIKKFK